MVKLHILHLPHCSRHIRSVSRTSRSVVEMIARYKAVLSAKSITLDLTCSGRQVIYVCKKENWTED